MRVTIIPEDKFVAKDGVGYDNLDFTIDPAIHAVQWYDTWGEIEYKTSLDGTQIVKPANTTTTDPSICDTALAAWGEAKILADKVVAEALAGELNSVLASESIIRP